MKNTCVNITGKLPASVVKLYADMSLHAGKLGIDFIVVGAMARDLVLVHGYGSSIERGTRDIDFGINVSSWDDFNALRDSLINVGYKHDARIKHRLNYEDTEGLTWEFDIVPFGNIADNDSNISWPPKHDVVMNVLGFSEAFKYSLEVQISEEPDMVIRVVSPAGMSILKLIAWMDRDITLRAKDAIDFEYLIQSYTKIPEIFDAIYDQMFMEKQGWDQEKASAMKLGVDAGHIVSNATRIFLKDEFFNDMVKKEKFARDMQRQNGRSLSLCVEWVNIFEEAFLG